MMSLEGIKDTAFWYVVLILIVSVVYAGCRSTNKNGLPAGPRIALSAHEVRHNVHLYFAEWAKTYGDVFSYKLGASNVLVLNSLGCIEELMVKRAAIYSSRPTSSPLADVVTSKSRILMMPYGDAFRRRRRIIHSLLGMHNAKIFLPYQDYESRQTLKHLLDMPEQFYRELERYAASVTFSLLLGARFPRSHAYLPQQINYMILKFMSSTCPPRASVNPKADTSQIRKLTTFDEDVRLGAWLPDRYSILNLLPTAFSPWHRAARAVALDMQDFWNVFVSAMEFRLANGTAPDCFLSRFLASPDAEISSKADKVSIPAELLAAGSESSASIMQWFFKACVIHPEFVHEAQQELDQVVGQDKLPEFSDRENLPYIDAVISELHRWSPLSPMPFYHTTSEADTYRGFTISKGTTVIANTWTIHRGEECFREPSIFRPGRWLPPTDPRHMINGRLPDLQHFNFGYGRRECPGKHVANASLFILMSRILWAFDIGGEGDEKGMETATPLPIVRPLPFRCGIAPRSEKIADIIRESAKIIDPDLKVEDASMYDEQIRDVLSKQRVPLKV